MEYGTSWQVAVQMGLPCWAQGMSRFCVYTIGNNYILPSEVEQALRDGEIVSMYAIAQGNSAGSSQMPFQDGLIMQMYTALCEEHGEVVPMMELVVE